MEYVLVVGDNRDSVAVDGLPAAVDGATAAAEMILLEYSFSHLQRHVKVNGAWAIVLMFYQLY